jgi:hypothetical protein
VWFRVYECDRPAARGEARPPASVVGLNACCDICCRANVVTPIGTAENVDEKAVFGIAHKGPF